MSRTLKRLQGPRHVALDEQLSNVLILVRDVCHWNRGKFRRPQSTLRHNRDSGGWPIAAMGAFLLICLSVACGVHASSGASYRIATHPATQFNRDARTGGTLNGVVNTDGTACLWLGEGVDRIALVWPDGYVARASPLEVLDEHGTQVAVVGSKVTLTGGLGATGTVTGCESIVQTWAVGQVLAPT
jgi:hypothetical protein